MTDRQDISVVVACTEGPAALRRLLGELSADCSAFLREIIVVDGTGAVTADDLAGASHGEVRLLGEVGADVAVLRAVGVRAAQGRLVVFLEDHCRLPADWGPTLLQTWFAGHRAFGGPIENGSFRAPPDWAAYLLEFGAFMPPLPVGSADRLPGMNVAYERALIQDLAHDSLCEPILNRCLQERGVGLHIDPALVVAFERRFGVLAFTRHCFAGGRTFGGLRMAQGSRFRHWTYAVASATALPFVMVLRTAAHVFGRRRARLAFMVALPWVALYSVAWSLGEATGTLQARQGEPGWLRSTAP